MEKIKSNNSIAVIGAGSWGTSIAKVMAENNPDCAVRMWAYEKTVVKSINEIHQNTEFLPNIILPENISATHSLKEALGDTRMVMLATPSKVIFDTAVKMRKHLSESAHVGFLSKGFVKIDDEIHTISDALGVALPRHRERIVAVSGPSHSEEVCLGYHTCLSVAGTNPESRREFIQLLKCGYIECRDIEDIRGVELGGTLKNPAAIAAGMLSVLPDCGDNLAGALMAEALKEMLRLAESFGAKAETIIDISGLGDLIATSLSEHSRNRRFGRDIARQIKKTGSSVSFYDRILLRFRPDQVLEKMSRRLNYLAEGAYAIEPLIEYAEKRNIFIPVYRSLYEILLNNRDPRLLIETVKNPDRFYEIFDSTRIHTTRRKKGMERAGGALFKRLILKKVLDRFNSMEELNNSLVEEARSRTDGAGPLSVLPDSNKHSIRERQALGKIESGNTGGPVEELAQLYLSDMTDRFNPVVYRIFNWIVKIRNFMINFFKLGAGRWIFTGNIRVTGNIREIRKAARSANVVYLATFRSYFDFLFLGMAISRFGLIEPRFLVNSALVTGPLRRMLIKFSGGYIVNIGRLGNPLYREVVKQYLATLLEHGVPVLFFPELLFFSEGKIMEINEEFISTIVDSLKKNTEEIALIPVELSYYRVPAGRGNLGEPGNVSWKKALGNTVRINFSRPVIVSDYSHRPDALEVIGSVVRGRWMNDAAIFPHYIFCHILRDHGYTLKVSDARRILREYLPQSRAGGFSAKEVLRAGMSFVQRHGLARVEDRILTVTDRSAVDFFADLVVSVFSTRLSR